MDKIALVLFVVFFASCDYFNAKKITPEAILKEELKTFKWDEVDQYPTFLSCDSALIKLDKKICFESTLSNYILKHLQQEKIVVTKPVKDTIMISFQVSKQGVLSIRDIKVGDSTKQQIPKITTKIKESIIELPKIYPALKRGQQVKIVFKLPIIILGD